jgi:outer membrane lipoprotein-sorting protein
VTAVGVVVAAAAAASASVPSLPHRTAAQLLAEVAQGTAKPLGPFTATVQMTADLGLPQLPQSAQPGGTGDLTSGTQSITIWYRDAQHVRVAEPVQAGESDLRLNGRTAWLWSSTTQTATRLALPAQVTGLPGAVGSGDGGTATAPKLSPTADPNSLTPAAAARQVLAAVGPSTVVAVQSNVDVAGRPAYQLALAPRSSKSLVRQVLIAIDASRDVPLRVEVLGRGSTGPVYSVGFTSLAFGTPAASNFNFTPPPGATVKQQVVPSSLQSVLKQAGLSPASLSGLPRAGSSSQSGGSARAPGPGQAGGPKVIGQDWLSVVASPPSAQVAAAVQSMLSGSGPGSPSAAQQSEFSSSSSASSSPVSSAYSSTLTINGGPGPDLAGLRALLLATTPVHGNWGSGRLLQTKLLSVLITSKGQILAGAVTPGVLYADLAADAG